MDSIPKFMASVITIIIGVLLCISLIFAGIVVNSARTYHASVIEQIEASNFHEATIEKCITAAESDNYLLKVEETTTPDSEPCAIYKVTLNYGLTAPLFGKVHIGELVGYALAGARVGSGGDFTPVPGLYETGSNYAPDKLLASWDYLVDCGFLTVTDGAVGTPYDSDTHLNPASDILAGDLLLPFDGSVTAISDLGFYICRELTGIKMPDSLKTVGQSAFAGDYGLLTVELGSGLEEIGRAAFNYTGWISTVTYTGTAEDWCRIKFNSMDANPFCWGADFYINGSSVIENLVIPSDVTTLEYVWGGCPSLKSVTIPADSLLTTIEDYTFDECINLESVTIEKEITAIGNYAFSYCNSLQEVTIPSTVSVIEEAAFSGCSNLQSIVVEEGNSDYYDIDDHFLVEAATNTLLAVAITSENTVIPEGVAIIGEYAFRDNQNLRNLTIPSSVTYFNDYAFNYCANIEGLSVVPGNTVYHSANNCIIDTANKKLKLGCVNSTIPTDGSVTSIGNYAFFESPLAGIVIPDTILSIGRNAFSRCKNLEEVIVPNSVTKIDADAFSYCSSLTDITIGSGATSIESSAFFGCGGVTSIVVDAENPNYFSAGNCLVRKSTKTLILGGATSVIPTDGCVTVIGSSSFYQCYNLTNITIPNVITEIGGQAFQSCTGLTSITIPASVTTIGNYAFRYCSGLSDVYFEGTIEQWNAIDFGYNWAGSTNVDVVHCSNGDVVNSQ